MKTLLKNRELSAFLAIVVLFAGLVALNPAYFSLQTLAMIFASSQILCLLALGATLVMLTRNIDVSVGSTVGLSAIAVGVALNSGYGLMTAMLLSGMAGATGYEGIGGFPDSFTAFANLTLFGLPIPLVLFAVITFFFWLLAHRGRFGRHLFLLGQNPRAARYAALSVNGMPYVLYGLVGVASARSDLGRDLLMPALTAAVLGGANIYGGSGSIIGTALAALLVGYLQQGLQMVGIPNQVSSVLSGALLVVVVMGRSLSLHREWVRMTWRRLFSRKTIEA